MLPRTETEIDESLLQFESCTLAKEQWTHSAHVLTGACYVHSMGEREATDKMRACVQRYNVAVGGENTETSGYHETITVAWMKLLARLLCELQPIGRAEFAQAAISQFGSNRRILESYYDFDVVNSTEARMRWIPPTLAPLD